MTAIQDFDEETTTKLLKGIDIPPQPQVLRLVMAEQRQPDPDLRKIAIAVTKDVGLSAAMLRAANSPAFGLRQKVTSISQAVMLLGMGNAISLITGLSLRMVMSGKNKVKLERFWDTASDAALICSVLARRFQIMAVDEAYMLGLFHDCGIPLLMQRFPKYMEILRQSNTSTEESVITMEDREFKTNHAVVGYLVARSWFLPEDVRTTILHHHDESLLLNADPDTADGILARKIGLLFLAEHFGHLYHRAANNILWERLGARIMQIFDLNEIELQDLSEDMKDALSAS